MTTKLQSFKNSCQPIIKIGENITDSQPKRIFKAQRAIW